MLFLKKMSENLRKTNYLWTWINNLDTIMQTFKLTVLLLEPVLNNQVYFGFKSSMVIKVFNAFKL